MTVVRELILLPPLFLIVDEGEWRRLTWLTDLELLREVARLVLRDRPCVGVGMMFSSETLGFHGGRLWPVDRTVWRMLCSSRRCCNSEELGLWRGWGETLSGG